MAATNNRGGKGKGKAASANKKSNTSNAKNRQVQYIEEPVFSPLITVVITVAVCVLVFLSNINTLGTAGEWISRIMFGIFGQLCYILPVLAVILVFAMYSVKENPLVKRRVICGILIYAFSSMLTELMSGSTKYISDYDLKTFWETGSTSRKGGGVLLGTPAFFLNKYLSTFGAVVLLIILILILILIFLGKDTLNSISDNSRRRIDESRQAGSERIREAKVRMNERMERIPDKYEDDPYDADIPRHAKKRRGIGFGIGSIEETSDEEEQGAHDDAPVVIGGTVKKQDKTPRVNKKVTGVANIMVGIDDGKPSKKKSTFDRDDIHEITVKDIDDDREVKTETAHAVSKSPYDDLGDITFNRGGADIPDEPVKAVETSSRLSNTDSEMKKTIKKCVTGRSRAYKMPPLNLLNKMEGRSSGTSKNELLDVAKTLQDTLETFGVKAKVTDISQGPSVTRFELQPEVGVRVNKIVSLADDIKLSLAATDIRIEAPIPGKSAVGIEVPNKESTGVGLRELLEDKTFKDFDSRICFAVGKDIAGKTIVADIAKMPHMLIAGATGSGKSVCINTIIMSILYKAHPDDVKLIMVDPKVVELSVYNGIPHLMVPVVTDPKKAAAALNWGVAEMTERYKRFADLNVRDLKGYNKKIDDLIASGKNTDDEGNEIHRLPQIVIIVDELADLMMVAAKEVEESICRLAQLARACGIHLIIATQRPSVDVITGLIKANMPSRIAFAVSSGVDSRTILDMNGAEKLLGKGDMLFFPQGYPKPARIQGAFVSDAEVGRVVDYLKEQDYVGISTADIENKISAASIGSGYGDSSGSGDDTDDLFVEAGRFIIAQDKASIGSLQRKFKIGFNRAARIMDQLAEAGVVSEDNGTKPRDVLMSPDQFERYVEEYI